MKRTLWISYADRETAAHAFSNMFSNVLIWNEGADIKPEDVVIFSGGRDINPAIYGELRGAFTDKPDDFKDERERIVFRRAQAAGASCIGICRGGQLLCALSGGKLLQHVTGHGTGHHSILNERGGMMKSSSTHHQMMFPFNINHHLLAWAVDRAEVYCDYGKKLPIKEGFHRNVKWQVEPEIVWFPDTRSLSIQGHPEEPYHNLTSPFPRYCQELVERFITGSK